MSEQAVAFDKLQKEFKEQREADAKRIKELEAENSKLHVQIDSQAAEIA